MKYREIPGTDLRVSALCLGTAPVGSALDATASHRILDEFVAGGGNFIDTARAYAIWIEGGMGVSERVIGAWLKDRGLRDSVIVATKGAHPAWTSMHIPRLARAEITADCEESLRNLGLDVIPLYWLHRDDPARPVADILDTMEGLVKAGKIRHYGCSNWSVARMREADEFARAHHLAGFTANQPMWSLARLNPESLADPTSHWMDKEMEEYHRASRLPVIPYTAQAKGFFAKLQAAGWDGVDPRLRAAYDNEDNRARFERLQRLARETGQSVSVLALAWLTSQPDFVTIPIVWSGRPEQLQEILQAGDAELGRDVLDALR